MGGLKLIVMLLQVTKTIMINLERILLADVFFGFNPILTGGLVFLNSIMLFTA